MSGNKSDSESDSEDSDIKIAKFMSFYEYIKKMTNDHDDNQLQRALELSLQDNNDVKIDVAVVDRDEITDLACSNDQVQLTDITKDDQEVKQALESKDHDSNDDQNDEDDIFEDTDPGPSNDQGDSALTPVNDSDIDVTNESAIERINNQLSTVIDSVLDDIFSAQNGSQQDWDDSDGDGEQNGFLSCDSLCPDAEHRDDSVEQKGDKIYFEIQNVSEIPPELDDDIESVRIGIAPEIDVEIDLVIQREIEQLDNDHGQCEDTLLNIFSSEAATFDCPICMSAHDIADSQSFGCSHLFCTQCLSQYFVTKLNERQIRDIRCPADGCALRASEAHFLALLPPELHNRYSELIWAEDVKHYDDVKPCPRCNYPVECYPEMGECSKCDHIFCPLCLAVYHGLTDCFAGEEREEDRRRREEEDVQSVRLISEQFKKCPNCQTDIEKDIGCYHMTCAQCLADFCWLCMGRLNGKEDVERHYTSKCVLFDHDFIKD